MGIYGSQVLPRIIDFACGTDVAHESRARVCAGLKGEVLEIGFGSGLNVPHYPGSVTRVSAVEPSDTAWKLASKRRDASRIPVDRSGLDGQALPFADDSFDAALSTWTLCTIPDVQAALAEVRRVLRPGGRLHFVEHGLSQEDGVVAWQRRLEPLQKRLFGGCHLARPIDELISGAGFEIQELDRFYETGSPRVFGSLYLGTATC
jgi:ubiquinone/menaquinone biosynthesis C-methylase UbiE